MPEVQRNYEPVDVTKHPEIQALLKSEGITVKKSAETLARTPLTEEVGTKITAYVKKSPEDFTAMQADGYEDESYQVEDGMIVVESRSKIQADSIVSRNPKPLGVVDGKEIFNEWPQGIDTWMKNYGVEPGEDFAPHKKTAANRVLKIDDKIMDYLCGDPDAKTATIAVSWSTDGQEVYKGGYIADAGYGLEQGEFDKTYETVENAGDAPDPKEARKGFRARVAKSLE